MAVFQEEDEALRERIERMMKVIETLPDMQQTILRLRHMEGMEFKEIAELTGSTEAAVRKALSRARQAVRDKFNGYEK
jgi:RNA polymerase sigma-70 factor (ECF subfamily)